MSMRKTQVYFRPADLRALARVARERKRPMAELIREAVKERWLTTPEQAGLPGQQLVGIHKGPLPAGFSSDNHDAAFDPE